MKKHLCHYQNCLTCDVQTVQLYPKPSDVIGPLSAPGTTKCYWLKDDQPAISNYTPLADQDAIEPIPALLYEELRERFLLGFSEGECTKENQLHSNVFQKKAYSFWFEKGAGCYSWTAFLRQL